MAVKIMIKRKIAKNTVNEALSLIMRLRTMAALEPGYISGETLRKMGDPEQYLVISVWQSADDWESWRHSKERSEIQDKIDALLGTETDYEIYHYPEKRRVHLDDFMGGDAD